MSRSNLSDKKRLLRNASLLLLLAIAAPMLFLGQRPQPRIPGQWIKGRNLSDARAGACTVSLSDGRMLTTGGRGRGGALASAELLSAAGDSASVSPMASARSEHLCATLDDGRVLVAGGRVAGDAATNAAEVYDAASDSWTSILSMREARIGATLTRISGGRLLIAGGEASGQASATLEIFDPSSGSFSLASGAMSSPRKGHAASLLRDGRVLIAGGVGGGSEGKTVLDTAEVFDPANGSIRPIGRMMVAREGLSATLLDNGQVLIAGGSDGSADLASSELFDAATMSFSPGPTMSSARRGHKAFLMPHNNTVVMAGGEAAGEPLATTEQFAWWGNRYAGEFRKLGDLSSARTQITGAPNDVGMLMIAGGMAARGVASASLDRSAVATVTTNKLDYQPGDIVYLSGNGFGPNDVVHVVIHENPDTHGDITVNVQANGSGAFSNVDVYHVEEHDLNVSFHLIATGDPSGITAETSFTDSVSLDSVSVSPVSPTAVTVNAGTAASFSVDVVFGNPPPGGGNCTATLSTAAGGGTGLPGGASVSFGANPISSGSAQTVNRTLSITTSTVGTYTFVVVATGTGGNCNGTVRTSALAKLIVNAANTPPTATVNLTPVSPTTNQTLTATATKADANGDTVTLTYVWKKGATVVKTTSASANLTDTLDLSVAGNGDKGDVITVEVTPNDGTVNGTMVSSSVTVVNSPPAATIASLLPAAPTTNQTLTVTATKSDPDTSDTVTLTYVWKKGATVVKTTSASANLTDTLDLSVAGNGDKGDVITVEVTPNDGTVNGTMVSSSVTVVNSPPAATIASLLPAAPTTNQTLTVTATKSDPDTSDTVTLTYVWKKGATVVKTTSASANLTDTLDLSVAGNGDKGDVITVEVTPNDGTVNGTMVSSSVTVVNSPPAVSVTGPSPVAEGQTLHTYTFTVTDPDPGDTFTVVSTSCGTNGTQVGLVTATATGGSFDCKFPDGTASSTVSAQVKDSDGAASDIGTFAVTINNVAPTATLSNNGPVYEGSPAGITFSSQSDPSAADILAGFQYAYACNGNAASLPLTYAAALAGPTSSCTFFDNGSFTVVGRIFDKDNGYSTYSTVVVVNNVAPSVLPLTLSAPSINENGSVSVSGMFSDPGSLDVHTITINWGDGSPNFMGTIVPTGNRSFGPISHQYLDDGPYPGNGTASDVHNIAVTVSDDDGGVSPAAGAPVTVSNVAPVALTTTASSQVVPIGGTSTVTMTFTDVGTKDIHTCTFNWDGGGPAQPVTVVEPSSPGSCSSTQTFMAAGVYSVKVTVNDDDLGSAIDELGVMIAVYDPNGGFVTGGGWIMSPAGAYIPNPALTGKANFGFVSKYKPGATTPTGNTEFDFKAGNMNFHSESYQWLVVAGARAQYKGVGKINNAGNYGFLLTGIDSQINGGGNTDKFRIKIWDKDNGDAPVYDNAPGSDDIDQSGGTPLMAPTGNGSIVIHK